MYRNTLVFLAADKTRLQDLDEAARKYLAWVSILAEKKALTLDTHRVGRDASRVAEEVIAHLSGLVGAEVKITLEIEATIPSGTPDHVVRTVTENSRTLKFSDHGFEKE